MGELIKITEKDGKQLVSARELHTFLNVSSNITTWFDRMCEYGFEEGKDFIPFLEESNGGRPSKDFALTLDCAKEISMIQRTEKGKQARRYFIEMEKIAKDLQEINPTIPSYQIENPIERAKSWIVEQEKIIQLQERNDKLEPRSLYFDKMIATDGLVSMQEVAKLLNIKDMGRNKMLEQLRIGNVFMKNSTAPYQHYINKGYFELKEEIIIIKGSIRKVNITTYATQKGLAFIFKFFGLTGN